jgi:N-acetylglutamate synthase-like GNAT family acetyltransferase
MPILNQKVKIIETKNYEIFKTLGKKFDLEISGKKDYFKAWVAVSNGKKIGGISLERQENTYLLGVIVVDKNFQKLGLGKKLVLTLLEYLKKEKIPKVYVNTKVPEFFLKFNFKKIPHSKVPKFQDCSYCPKYHKTCFPTHMLLELKDFKSQE